LLSEINHKYGSGGEMTQGLSTKEINEATITSLCREAEALKSEQLYDKAVGLYKAIIKPEPAKVSFRKCLAGVYLTNRAYAEAQRISAEAIKMAASSFWLWRDLCEGYIRTSDGAVRAKAICKRAIRMFPTNPAPVLTLVMLYIADRSYNEAIEAYMKLVQNFHDCRMNLVSAVTKTTEPLAWSAADWSEGYRYLKSFNSDSST
jgi:tetratricopeptide (TPR) repeat protein